MGTYKIAGFTIIETVLFLGISGLLIVSLIGGVGASLNNQRYRDAAETFKLVLQQQYADLTSVQNTRNNDWQCGPGATPVDVGSDNQDRGQSDCVLIGKYVRVENENVAVYTVVGYGAEPVSPTDDISVLRDNYTLRASQVEVAESTLEWGAKIAWPKTLAGGVANTVASSPRKLGILIVRSPTSGQIYTFTSTSSTVPNADNIDPEYLKTMVVAGDRIPGQAAQIICIDSNGLFTTSDRAVYLNSYASSSSAVELRTNAFMTRAVAQC